MEIEKKTRFLKQSYYEGGPRANRLLAKRLKKQQADRTIHKIKDIYTNQIIYEPKEIEQKFVNFYRDLYSQPPSADVDQMKAFLEELDLPTIGKKHNDLLTSPITIADIKRAVNRLKTNKSPGSDGLPAEWYKKFSDELIPILEVSFNHTLKYGETPPSWKEAIISVIPKKNNSETCSDFRPISLLNVDYKLYTSIISKRYEYFIREIIDEDQTGFIKGRQTQDNIRRAIHIINHIQNNQTSAVLMSLDAEKAFDSVNWTFLYLVLEKFGFSDEAVKCIKTLYQKPTARIRINGNLTESITLERSTRQGCCLSPILFAIFLEPLAQAVRQNKYLKGIKIGEEKHTIALFADDVVCFLKDPDTGIPILINLLETFGFCSGYKLNLT
uniref:Reverse transcriptase domain-containing protein n=1 Tax=Amphilophus citrinellus TaxID=61819 RepID=A0A3Q0RMJ3_AMPCI